MGMGIGMGHWQGMGHGNGNKLNPVTAYTFAHALNVLRTTGAFIVCT